MGNDPSKNSIRQALSNDFQSILAGELGTGKKEVAGWSVAKIASGPVSTECECYIFTRGRKVFTLCIRERLWILHVFESCLSASACDSFFFFFLKINLSTLN